MSTPEHASAKDDGNVSISDTQATNGGHGGHHDLVRKLVDKLLRHLIALRGGGENGRRKLAQTIRFKAACVDRLHNSRRGAHFEMFRNQALQQSPFAAAIPGAVSYTHLTLPTIYSV